MSEGWIERMSLLGLGLALAGCGPSSLPPEPWTTRDSAEVTIVTNHEPAWIGGAGWTVPGTPLLRVLGDPDRPLFNLKAVMRLGDGRIVIANQGQNELQYFGRGGQLVHAVGREGEGPGEFLDIALAVRCGNDSVTVYDRRTLQASVFDEDGAFVRSYTPRFLSEMSIWPRSLGCQPNGTELVVGWPGGPPPVSGESRTRSMVLVLVMHPDSTAYTVLGEFEGTEAQDWVNAEGSGWWGYAPFPLRTSILLWAGEVFVASGNGAEIGVYDLDGRLRRLIRWRSERIPVSAEDIRRFEQALLDTLPENRRRITEPLLPGIEYPEVMPPYGEVLIDILGHLWIENPAGATAYQWTIVDPDGRWLGDVAIPEQVQIHQIGQDFILGVRKDELGVESVVMFGLDRGR